MPYVCVARAYWEDIFARRARTAQRRQRRDDDSLVSGMWIFAVCVNLSTYNVHTHTRVRACDVCFSRRRARFVRASIYKYTRV